MFNLFRRQKQQNGRRPQRRDTRRRMFLEQLQSREMMAADLQVSLVDDVLRIEGTDQADEIVVEQANGFVSVGGVDGTWPQPSQILVQSGAGDDVIRNNTNISSELYGGRGQDKIYGGDGTDTIDGGEDSDSLYGNGGNDTIYGGAGGSGDLIEGGRGDDKLDGGAGNDLLRGGLDRDTIHGGEGTDTIDGGEHSDWLYGDNGNDTIYGGAGGSGDLIEGGRGDDKLDGGAGNDLLRGGLDRDTIHGGEGTDTIDGGAHSDWLYGDNGNDTIYGGAGGSGDLIEGGSGDDTLDGGAGNDLLRGGADRDIVHGGYGTDTLYGDAGADELYGDAGNDTLYDYRHGEDNLLVGGDGDDTAYGGYGDDVLVGGNGNDYLNATYGGNNVILGNAGNDILYGGHGLAGNNLVQGGEGNDRIAIINRAVATARVPQARFDWIQGGFGEDFVSVEGTKLDDRIDVLAAVGESPSTAFVELGVAINDDRVYVHRDRHAGQDDVLLQITQDGKISIISGDLPEPLEPASDADEVSTSVIVSIDDGSVAQHRLEDVERVEAYGLEGDDRMEFHEGLEHLILGRFYGHEGNDILIGSHNRNMEELIGGNGDDFLWGKDGNDKIWGDAGNDVIIGGAGADTLEGSEGDDLLVTEALALTFLFDDMIHDFVADWSTQGEYANLARLVVNDEDPFDRPTDDAVGANVTIENYDKLVVDNKDRVWELRGTNLQVNGKPGWRSVKDFAISDDGSYYLLQTTGSLIHYRNGWQTIARGVDRFELRAGSTYALQGTSLLLDGVATWNAKDFQFDSNDTLHILNPQGWLGRKDASGWHAFGTDFDQFTITSDDAVYGLRNSGTLEVIRNDEQVSIATGVDSIEISAGMVIAHSTGTTFTLQGTEQADAFSIDSFDDDRVLVRTATARILVERGAVTQFVVNANSGDDLVVNSTDIPIEVHGGSGDDTLVGGTGIDKLFGDSGSDILYGNKEDAVLRGDSGQLYVTGPIDDIDSIIYTDSVSYDSLFETATINGTEGDDRITAIVNGNHLLLYVSPHETDGGFHRSGVSAEPTARIHLTHHPVQRIVMKGGEGDDIIENQSTVTMVAYGGDGNDTLRSHNDQDGMFGGAGEDTLDGNRLFDAIALNDGVLFLAGGEDADQIEILQNDGYILVSNHGERLARKWAYNPSVDSDVITRVVVHGGDGDDTLQNLSIDLPASLYGNDGDDTLIGIHDQDGLFGGANYDILDGNTHIDALYVRGDGVLVVQGTDGNDEIELRRNDGRVYVYAQAVGGALTQTARTLATPERIEVYGGEGDDVLTNYNVLTQVMIHGDGGDDELAGFTDQDGLFGGADNDTLEGNKHLDAVYFDDDGNLVVVGTDGEDHIELHRNDGRVYVQAGPADKTMTTFGRSLPTTSRIKLHGGAGGDILANHNVLSQVVIDGGVGDDVLTGHTDADGLIGGPGSDTLDGNNHLDAVYFDDDGNLVVVGTNGSDHIELHRNDGRVYVSAGPVGGTVTSFNRSLPTPSRIEVYGGDGNDVLANHNVLTQVVIDGGAGDDVLTGHTDADGLIGGAGNDTLDGNNNLDAVYFDDDGNLVVVGTDRSDHVRLHRNDGRVYVSAGPVGGTMTAFSRSLPTTSRIEVYGGDGNDVLTNHNVLTQVVIDGGVGDDVLTGHTDADGLIGGAGNDTLDGNNNLDAVYFNDDGDLVVVGTDSEDHIELHRNDDRVYVSAGPVGGTMTAFSRSLPTTSRIEVYGGAGGDVLANHNVLTQVAIDGGAGDDVLTGHTDADGLIGGEGDDTLDGNKYLDAVYFDDDGNLVVVGTNGSDHIELHRNDGHVYVSAGPVGGTMTSFNRSLPTPSRIEMYARNGNDWIENDTDFDLYALGGDGKDTIIGGGGNDILYGGDDDDTISGRNGNDIIFGNAGTDVLQGDSGNDSIIKDDSVLYDVASGTVTVTGSDDGDILRAVSKEGKVWIRIGKVEEGTDEFVAVFDVGYAKVDQIRMLGGKGDDIIENLLTNEHKGVSTYIDGGTGKDQFKGGAGNDHFVGRGEGELFNGFGGVNTLDYSVYDQAIYAHINSMWVKNRETDEQIDALDNIWNMVGTGYDDLILGDDHGNMLFGGPGDDEISGKEGNDIVIGNAGEDVLNGNTGNDSIIQDDNVHFNSATGVLKVVGTESGDRLRTVKHEGKVWVYVGDNEVGPESDKFAAVIHADVKQVVIAGQGGADYIRNDTSINSLIQGGDEDDIIHGGNGNDEIYGLGGNDSIDGNGGDDTLHGGLGDDHLNGGDGGQEQGDTVSYAYSQTPVTVHLGRREADGEGHDTIVNMENVRGSQGNDTLLGDSNNNQFYGLAGNDRIDGNGGDDTLHGGLGDDHLNGGDGGQERGDTVSYAYSQTPVTVHLGHREATGEGHDTIINMENVTGSGGDDTLLGDDNPNQIHGLAGKDSIDGNGGDDTLYGGPGDDHLNGGDGGEVSGDWVSYATSESGVTIHLGRQEATGDGRDEIINVENAIGSQYRDEIYGDNNDNRLYGLDGNDSIDGNLGSDTLAGGQGDDHLNGGRHASADNDPATDQDTVSYASAPSAVHVYLDQHKSTLGDGNDEIFNVENVIGSNHNDYISGDWWHNRVWGLDGDDTIEGKSGDDILDGGDGTDWIYGHHGHDTLIAGKDGDDVLDPDKARSHDNDTYIVEGTEDDHGQRIDAPDGWRYIRRNGDTVHVRADNYGSEKLYYGFAGQFDPDAAQDDGMGDGFRRFTSSLTNMLENIGKIVLTEMPLPGNAFTNTALVAEATNTEFAELLRDKFLFEAAIGLSVGGGAAAGALAAGASTTTSIAVGAAGGAVGSIGSQAMNAAILNLKFTLDWGSVAVGAVSGGFGGLMSSLQSAKMLSSLESLAMNSLFQANVAGVRSQIDGDGFGGGWGGSMLSTGIQFGTSMPFGLLDVGDAAAFGLGLVQSAAAGGLTAELRGGSFGDAFAMGLVSGAIGRTAHRFGTQGQLGWLSKVQRSPDLSTSALALISAIKRSTVKLEAPSLDSGTSSPYGLLNGLLSGHAISRFTTFGNAAYMQDGSGHTGVFLADAMHFDFDATDLPEGLNSLGDYQRVRLTKSFSTIDTDFNGLRNVLGLEKGEYNIRTEQLKLLRDAGLLVVDELGMPIGDLISTALDAPSLPPADVLQKEFDMYGWDFVADKYSMKPNVGDLLGPLKLPAKLFIINMDKADQDWFNRYGWKPGDSLPAVWLPKSSFNPWQEMWLRNSVPAPLLNWGPARISTPVPPTQQWNTPLP